MKPLASLLTLLLVAGCNVVPPAIQPSNTLSPQKPVTYRAPIAPLMIRAAYSDCIGAKVGYSGAPSHFELVKRKLQPIATVDDCRQMVEDPNVYARLMGLCLLAEKFPDAAKPAYVARVNSTVEFVSYSGCIGRCVSEGAFASSWLDRELSPELEFDHGR
jgi:hypothetical protein